LRSAVRRSVIDTYQALAVTLVALLPGALYTFNLERQAGRWGAGTSDRLLRFLAASAGFHVLLAPASYQGYRTWVRTGQVAAGRALPWWLWLVLIGYVAVPAFCGDAVGRGTRRRATWATWFTGPSPAPRAWDNLFAYGGRTGWVRLRLLDPGTVNDSAGGVTGRWMVGAYSDPRAPGDLGGYAAGYPESQDLYLADTAVCSPVTGDFILGGDGRPQLRGVGVLIRWEQIAYLEFIEA
jgi:hypothetical protein